MEENKPKIMYNCQLAQIFNKLIISNFVNHCLSLHTFQLAATGMMISHKIIPRTTLA